jgi:beta-glucosidase
LRAAINGTLPMAHVNDAVARILRVKAKLGVLGAKPMV